MERLIGVLDELRAEALLLTREPTVYAFSGVRSDNAALLVTRKSVRLFTDFRYIAAARRLTPGLDVVEMKRLKAVLGRLGRVRVGVEFGMPHSKYLELKRLCAGGRFVDATAALSARRAIKSERELASLRSAVALNDEIWQEVRALLAPGMSERDIAAEINRRMYERGEGPAFETIVCIGRNAAECHHLPDGTRWNGRESILVDMGVRRDGWCSDMTRCVRPVRKGGLYARVYDLVRRANEAAIAAARPGMTGRALDRVARRIISQGGFGRCFGHSLGHGVGVEIHEAPYASVRSNEVLKPGMTLTIEPGIYLEDNLGVRIEDLVVITETGCEVLTRSEK